MVIPGVPTQEEIAKLAVVPTQAEIERLVPRAPLPRETAAEIAEVTPVSEPLEETHQRPGAGDMWIRKEDYDSLSPYLQDVYDKGGWEALEPAIKVEPTRLTAEREAAEYEQRRLSLLKTKGEPHGDPGGTITQTFYIIEKDKPTKKGTKTFMLDEWGYVIPDILKKATGLGEKHIVEAQAAREAEKAAGETVHSISYHLEQASVTRAQESKGGLAYDDMNPEQQALYTKQLKAGVDIAQAALAAIAPVAISVVIPGLEDKEQELKEALGLSETITDEMLAKIGIEREEYEKSVKDVEAKLAVIEQAKAVEAGTLIVEDPEAYEAYIRLAISPFATHTPEGIIIDVVTALKVGVGVEEIKSWGISDETISEAKESIEAEKVLGVERRSLEELQRMVDEGEMIRLPDDRYIPTEEWNRLAEKYQTIALEQGWNEAQVAWNDDHVYLPDGTWMLKSDYERIKETTPDEFEVLESEGYGAFSTLFIAVGEDEQMLKSDYEALPPEYKEVVDAKGVVGLNKYLETGILGTTVSRLDEIASPDFYRLGGSNPEAIALTGAMRRAGFTFPSGSARVDFRNLTDEEKQKVAEQYIPPTGFGISSEAKYALGQLRETLERWAAPEISPGMMTVKQLDEIASYEFTELGWGAKDHIALANAMRVVGMKYPGVVTYRTLSDEDKQKVAEAWGASGPIEEILAAHVTEPVTMWLEEWQDWAKEANLPPDKFGRSALVGLAGVLAAIPAVIIPSILTSVEQAATGDTKKAVVTLSTVPLGMTQWVAVDIAERIEEDPVSGVGALIGELALLAIVPTALKAVRAVKIQKAIQPTIVGEVVVWRGLTLGDRPIIGLSRGRLTLGAKGTKYPDVSIVKLGWEPRTALEVRIFKPEKVGMVESETIKITETLVNTKSFVGKESPHLAKEVITEPIKTLSREGVEATLRKFAEWGDEVKTAYGMFAGEPQLAPRVRGMRPTADIDVQFAVSLERATMRTRELLNAYKVTEGADRVRISPESPTVIETLGKDGRWHHAFDGHAKGEISPYANVEMAYGIKFEQPSLVIELPGIGKFRIMRLDEMGARKMSSILEWREGKVGPPEYRFKDVVDYYRILETYRGKKVADAWAKDFGYDPMELSRVARETPMQQIWEFVPEGKVISPPATVSPIVTFFSPRLLAAALSPTIGSLAFTSPDIVKALTTSIETSPILYPEISPGVPSPPTPAKVTPEVASKVISEAISEAISPEVVSPKVLGETISKAISETITESPEVISVAVSAAISEALTSKGISPEVVSKAVEAVSPLISPSIGLPYEPQVPYRPYVPYKPYVPYEPYVPYKPYKPYVPPPTTLLPPSDEDAVKRAYEKGLPVLIWRQGALRDDVWKAVIDPVAQVRLLTVVGTDKLPVKPKRYATGVGSAKKTMQWLGEPPGYAGSADLGIVDVYWGANDEEIHFKGGGLETDVGKRLPSPTKGISIPKTREPEGMRVYEERELGVEEERTEREMKKERLVTKSTLPEMLEIFK